MYKFTHHGKSLKENRTMLISKYSTIWDTITTVQFRSADSLSQKYKSIKKDIRWQHSKEKKYVNDAGGGPYQKSVDLTEEESELAKIIVQSVEGLPNWYGSDQSTQDICKCTSVFNLY